MKIDINNAVFELKKIQNIEEYFPDYIETYLNSYIVFLEKNKIKADIIALIKEFSRKIYICLVEYYCGQHDSAKFYFDQAINCVNFKDIYTPLEEEVFYRARKSTKTYVSKDEMFHIPLEKRHLVSTQRYSYPGLPCLYLGSSYEVCCDELNDWNENVRIAYIEKNSLNKLSILDLCFFKKFDFDQISDEDVDKFIRLWPLVACCSFVYENANDMKFRPDYIIPQLLLEYIIDKNADADIKGFGEKVCGIKYHSVKKSFFKNNDETSKNMYNNYVFPVISGQPKGYCNVLKKMFEVKWVRLLGEIKGNES